MAAKSFGPAAPDRRARHEILRTEGPTLDIIIRPEPRAVIEDGVPTFISTSALIDTGASDLCIDYRIAHALKLREIDQLSINVVGGSIPASVYLGDLEIPALGYREIVPLIASRVARINYNALIGRQLLSRYIVTFDGPKGCFHFMEGDHGYPEPPDDE